MRAKLISFKTQSKDIEKRLSAIVNEKGLLEIGRCYLSLDRKLCANLIFSPFDPTYGEEVIACEKFSMNEQKTITIKSNYGNTFVFQIME